MKKWVITINLILWSILPISADEQVIHLTNGEWPPYLSDNLKHGGVISQIVTEAFALEGIQVKYGFFPWARSYVLAQMGKWEGSVVWSRSPEREKDFLYSDPVFETRKVFFHLKDYPFDWSSLDDLKDVIIGATLKYNYGPEFHEIAKSGKIHVEYAVSDEINIKLLLLKRIQVFPIQTEVGYSILHKHFKQEEIQRITHHPKTLMQSPYHLILSKKVGNNKNLLRSFNKGLKQLKDSGKIEQYFTGLQKGEYLKK